jgi:hypothetical protein
MLQNIDFCSDIMMRFGRGLLLADSLAPPLLPPCVCFFFRLSDEKLARTGLLPEKYAFIAKPFLDDHLARLLRSLLV